MRRHSDVWGFLAFSHGSAWVLWTLAVLRGEDVWSSPLSLGLLAAGGLGVPVGGIVMTWRVDGREGLRDLGRRIVDPRRIGGWWWAAVLLLYPGIKLLAGTLDAVFGGSAQPLDLQAAARLVTQPADFLLFAAFILLLGPVPEEIGWRGYLLDRLQQRWGALGASLAVGGIWFTWHLPLFFLPGYFARARGAPDPVRWAVGIILASILITWIYNNTGRSVLAAILVHFADNLSGELLDPAPATEVYTLLLTTLVVLLVLVRCNPGSLRRARPPMGSRS